MPITPRFNLSQTASQIIITIHIPHIRVSASTLEIIVDKTEFHFYSNPYLLHLDFSPTLSSNCIDGELGTNRNLLDDELTNKEAKATYDPSKDNGTLVVKIWKEEECIWHDLDLLGKLMVNNNHNNNMSKPSSYISKSMGKIQVLESTQSEGTIDDENESGNLDVEDKNLDDIQSCFKPHYGFLKMHYSVFTDYAREGLSHEMLEIPNPDETLTAIDGDDNDNDNMKNIREMRLQIEDDKFCPNRYLGDLYLTDNYEDEEDADMTFIEAKNMFPHWQSLEASSHSQSITSVDVISNQLSSIKVHDDDSEVNSEVNENHEHCHPSFFTEEESTHLASIKGALPPLSQISSEQTQSTLLSLLDILYAYVYDHRITCGESTCESSWTIVMLSPTLSWLESYNAPYDTIDQVIRWSIRRALIFPYLRNFDMLCNQLVNDVKSILFGGRRVVLRCLLQIHRIFDRSETHYLFNKLFINQYICWTQLVDESILKSFARKVNDVMAKVGVLNKEMMGLDLIKIEEEAFKEQVQEEEESEDSEDDESYTSSSYNGSSIDDTDTDEDDETKNINCKEENTKKKSLITEIC